MCAPMRIPGTGIAVTIPGPVRQTIHTSTKAVLVLVINGETRERFELWRVVVGSIRTMIHGHFCVSSLSLLTDSTILLLLVWKVF